MCEPLFWSSISIYILNSGGQAASKASVILFTGIEVEKRILFLYVSYLKLPEPGLAEIFIV